MKRCLPSVGISRKVSHQWHEVSALADEAKLRGNMEAGCIRIVTQRCARARLLVDAEQDEWVEVGRGLVFYVSFAQGSAGAEGDLLFQ